MPPARTCRPLRPIWPPARTSLADAELRAPSDGIVLSRVREPGAIVSPSDIVYVLSLTGRVWVRAYVAEPDLGRIHPGMIVEVTTDTAPDKPYKGRIGFISPVAEFTPKSVETPDLRTDLVYRLRVIIDQPDTGLRQGMPVTIRLLTIPQRPGPIENCRIKCREICPSRREAGPWLTRLSMSTMPDRTSFGSPTSPSASERRRPPSTGCPARSAAARSPASSGPTAPARPR